MGMRKRVVSFLMAVMMCLSVMFDMSAECLAATKTFTLKQAQNLAISNDRDYKKILTKLDFTQVKLQSAVRKIAMKKKNMSTFRWTPLLSFKFPEKPSLADEYDWAYKPLQIQSTIDALKHELMDTKIAAKEEISLLYVEAYSCQEQIAFYTESLKSTEASLERNRARLLTGEASQADIDKLEQKKKNLEMKLSLQMRTFEAKKSKISDLTGLDITSGYQFEDPFVSADIPRSMVNGLVDYTLENDQSFYETKLETKLCLTSLNTIEQLMKTKYGGNLNTISGYIQQIKNGRTIDERNFKLDYDKFLTAVDNPWTGNIRILFIRIPKEWFKGAKDGTRYVEDDPYLLYSTALEYADALETYANAEKELTGSVKDGFETLVTAKNSYESAKESSEELKEELERATIKNQLGEFTFEELSDLQAEYEEAQLEALSQLGEYSKLLYSYDRLTCGAITAYLEGESFDGQAASGGISYLEEQAAEGAAYYIIPKVEDQVFLLGVTIPEDYSIEVTDFELYIDGTRIGEKTESSTTLRHLALDLESYEKAEIYLYSYEELAAVCEIDAKEYIGPLEVSGGYVIVKEETEKAVADFSYTVNQTLKITELTFRRKQGEAIAYYQIADVNGTAVLREELIPIEDPFLYLSVLSADFSGIKVLFYDEGEQLLYEGRFDERTSEIVTIVE